MKKNQLVLGLLLLTSIAVGYLLADKLISKPKVEQPPEPDFSYTVDEKLQFAIPADYPNFVVPIMPGGKILAASKRTYPTDQKDYYSVIIATDKSLTEVANYYQQALKNRDGFKKSGTPKYIFFKGSSGSKLFTVSIATGKVNAQPKTILTIQIGSKDES